LKITANPLTGASTDYNYTWQVPSGVTNPGNVSSFPATTAGVYTARIKNKITNCESGSINSNVSFYPLPSAAAIVASDNKVIVNKNLNLTAAASGGKNPYYFTWTPNPTINYSISGQENAVFTALKEGKVKFKYQVKDANNCQVNSADYEITIESEDIILVLPNAFTPNGDGNNDEFKIAATNTLGEKSFVYFEIYNRNGKLLTNKITDIKAGWNGRSLDNVMQDMGVYFVKLVKLDKDGKQVVETTPIYLLK
jgi:gliding motility-associated-like protein